MTAPRRMSDLEWIGWEVAAARLLAIPPAGAAILHHLVARAPEMVTREGLRQLCGLTSDRAMTVYVCEAREALRGLLELGGALGAPPHMVRGSGYRLDGEEAARIQAAVETSVRRAA